MHDQMTAIAVGVDADLWRSWIHISGYMTPFYADVYMHTNMKLCTWETSKLIDNQLRVIINFSTCVIGNDCFLAFLQGLSLQPLEILIAVPFLMTAAFTVGGPMITGS
jgi:hypothetical protein